MQNASANHIERQHIAGLRQYNIICQATDKKIIKTEESCSDS